MSKTTDDTDNNGIIDGDLVVSGNVTANGYVAPTTGGTPTTLDYYEEYNYSSTFTGCGTITDPISLRLTRTGRIVTCSYESMLFTASTAGVMTLTTAFPARFNQSSFTGNQHFTALINTNTSVQLADASINSSNQIIFTGSASSGTFMVGSCVIFKSSTSWTF